ncbi:MAG TPA: MmcQ/YjbR family DNA-binding protein [Candidatus Acidoferrum sp.]|nr:MmcQ/YjbR family DNA-binding protein [Candidatus Acidoferrum sp.]
MNSVESIRKLCLSFPHATEQVQWGYDLVFKIGGKMFAITPLEPAPVFLTFKATDESFAELTERQGIIPAPYLARAKMGCAGTRQRSLVSGAFFSSSPFLRPRARQTSKENAGTPRVHNSSWQTRQTWAGAAQIKVKSSPPQIKNRPDCRAGSNLARSKLRFTL